MSDIQQQGSPHGQRQTITVAGAVSIGIGGMVGASIYPIVGVSAAASGNAQWVSFILGGVAALLLSYSYAKLGAKYPSPAGASKFLVEAFGDGPASGGVNVFMWVSWVIALALYVHTFSTYVLGLFGHADSALAHDAIAVGAMVFFTVLNAVGAGLVGKTETYVSFANLAVLATFAIAGLVFLKPAYLSVSQWPAPGQIVSASGIIFIGYQGFGLVANTAGNMTDPARQLPKALYTSLALVIILYIGVSLAAVGNLSVPKLVASKESALAVAAQAVLGGPGAALIGVGAILGAFSAINATLFGSASDSYMLARWGQLPRFYDREVLGKYREGLLVTSGLVVVSVLVFNIAEVAVMGSAAFLLIYACVGAAHLKLIDRVGGRRGVIWLSIVVSLTIFVLLAHHLYITSIRSLAGMVGFATLSFVAEVLYRRFARRN